MSFSIISAFNYIISLQGRSIELTRGATTITIVMAPSNYFRNFTAMEEMVIDGKEFVITKASLDKNSFGPLRRGDFLYDPDLDDEDTIADIKPLFILGTLVGYRVRTS